MDIVRIEHTGVLLFGTASALVAITASATLFREPVTSCFEQPVLDTGAGLAESLLTREVEGGMQDRTLVRWQSLAVAGGTAAAAVGSALWIVIGGAELWATEYGPFSLLFTLFFAATVWTVSPRQPRNAVIWTMASCSVFGGIWFLGMGAAMAVGGDPVLVVDDGVVPALLPRTAAIILMMATPVVVLAFFPLATFGMLLFPDGRLPSPRWRWVGVLAVAGMAGVAAGLAWGARPWHTGEADQTLLTNLGWVLLVPAMLLSLSALFVRYRRSPGSVREQIRLVVWGAGMFIPLMILATALGGTSYENWIYLPLLLGGLVFLSAYGVAVSKYRLFDVDLVISRTVVVAGLAAFITVVYATVVGGVGLLLGTGTDADLPLSIAATVLVAIAFQPVRERMRRWADRIVYGERATPYEVLSRFSARLRDSVASEELLPQLVQLLAAGTGAQRVTVWLRSDDQLRALASWPDNAGTPESLPVTDLEVSVPGLHHHAPVEHEGELLGAVTVTVPPGQPLTTTEERLVDDAASQAALVLRNRRLTADLLTTVEQLRASRQRLVAAQDEERRRLERDLHDGAQQQFIAVKLKAATAARLAERGDHEKATALFEQVVADVDEGIQALRDLAHGIYPPLLEAEGLRAALSARVQKLALPVVVRADGVGRHPRDVEAAVYFCVLEALQNVAKYADAESVTVILSVDAGHLTFEVIDDGRGFDPGHRPAGRGLTNMSDRLEALGGQLAIRSSVGAGTQLRGLLPVRDSHVASTVALTDV